MPNITNSSIPPLDLTINIPAALTGGAGGGIQPPPGGPFPGRPSWQGRTFFINPALAQAIAQSLLDYLQSAAETWLTFQSIIQDYMLENPPGANLGTVQVRALEYAGGEAAAAEGESPQAPMDTETDEPMPCEINILKDGVSEASRQALIAFIRLINGGKQGRHISYNDSVARIKKILSEHPEILRLPLKIKFFEENFVTGELMDGVTKKYSSLLQFVFEEVFGNYEVLEHDPLELQVILTTYLEGVDLNTLSEEERRSILEKFLAFSFPLKDIMALVETFPEILTTDKDSKRYVELGLNIHRSAEVMRYLIDQSPEIAAHFINKKNIFCENFMRCKRPDDVLILLIEEHEKENKLTEEDLWKAIETGHRLQVVQCVASKVSQNTGKSLQILLEAIHKNVGGENGFHENVNGVLSTDTPISVLAWLCKENADFCRTPIYALDLTPLEIATSNLYEALQEDRETALSELDATMDLIELYNDHGITLSVSQTHESLRHLINAFTYYPSFSVNLSRLIEKFIDAFSFPSSNMDERRIDERATLLQHLLEHEIHCQPVKSTTVEHYSNVFMLLFQYNPEAFHLGTTPATRKQVIEYLFHSRSFQTALQNMIMEVKKHLPSLNQQPSAGERPASGSSVTTLSIPKRNIAEEIAPAANRLLKVAGILMFLIDVLDVYEKQSPKRREPLTSRLMKRSLGFKTDTLAILIEGIRSLKNQLCDIFKVSEAFKAKVANRIAEAGFERIEEREVDGEIEQQVIFVPNTNFQRAYSMLVPRLESNAI